jgi:predicted lactoylglutathione lyase
MTPEQEDAKVYMEAVVECEGISTATQLAEDTAIVYNLNLDDPDHWVWELAFEVVEKWEKTR